MNAFEIMATEGKSDRDLLVEMHTHLLGDNGLMERMKTAEKNIDEGKQFQTKWATIAMVIAGGIAFAFNIVKEAVANWFHNKP